MFEVNLLDGPLPGERHIVACDHLRSEYVWSDGKRSRTSPCKVFDNIPGDYRFWPENNVLSALTEIAGTMELPRKEVCSYDHCVCEDCIRIEPRN